MTGCIPAQREWIWHLKPYQFIRVTVEREAPRLRRDSAFAYEGSVQQEHHSPALAVSLRQAQRPRWRRCASRSLGSCRKGREVVGGDFSAVVQVRPEWNTLQGAHPMT